MASFLLVHGSWHGAWCWDPVVKRLRAAGHHVRAMDLPGHGEDMRDPSDVSLAHYSGAIQAEIAEMGDNVILVGHSMGGVAISAACGGAQDAIAKMVFVAALIPKPNDTLIELTERHLPVPRLLDAAVEVEGLVGIIKPERAHELFYTDCDLAIADPLIRKLGPEPLVPHLTPIRMSESAFAALPKLYIECTQDRTIPLGAQRAMLRDAKITDVISLASAHSPFVSMPDQLVDILASLEEAQAA